MKNWNGMKAITAYKKGKYTGVCLNCGVREKDRIFLFWN